MKEQRNYLEQLNSLECHFNWDFGETLTDETDKNAILYQLDRQNMKMSPKTKMYIDLNLIYHYSNIREFDKALSCLENMYTRTGPKTEGAKYLQNAVTATLYDRMSIFSYLPLDRKSRTAAVSSPSHRVRPTENQRLKGRVHAAKIALSRIQRPFEIMNARDKIDILFAKVDALKYFVYMESKPAFDMSLEICQEMIRLDPGCTPAYYTFACNVIDMIKNGSPTEYSVEDALKAIRKGIEMSSSLCLILKGGKFILLATSLVYGEEKLALQEEAFALFVEHYKIANTCQECSCLAFGFARLGRKFHTLSMAEMFHKECIQMEPSAFNHYKYASFLYRYKNDPENALSHLDQHLPSGKVSLLQADIERLEINVSLDPRFNIEEELLFLTDIYKDLTDTARLLCYLGDYFRLYSPLRALRYYKTAREIKPDFERWGRVSQSRYHIVYSLVF